MAIWYNDHGISTINNPAFHIHCDSAPVNTGYRNDFDKAQTYLFDALGRHAFTVAELASASDIAKAIAGLQAQGL